MVRVLLLALFGALLALGVAGFEAALFFGLALLLGGALLWRMPCGRAGLMVLWDAGLLVFLSGKRAALGELGFWLLLLYGLGAIFLVYKRAALDGEAGCGAACPAPHAPHASRE